MPLTPPTKTGTAPQQVDEPPTVEDPPSAQKLPGPRPSERHLAAITGQGGEFESAAGRVGCDPSPWVVVPHFGRGTLAKAHFLSSVSDFRHFLRWLDHFRWRVRSSRRFGAFGRLAQPCALYAWSSDARRVKATGGSLQFDVELFARVVGYMGLCLGIGPPKRVVSYFKPTKKRAPSKTTQSKVLRLTGA